MNLDLQGYWNHHENIVDPNLENNDPTPDLINLFRQFNVRFFWNKLNMVEVSWAKNMSVTAGLCRFDPRNGHVCIRLNANLLSLRPRKDLVETLLHEMIHAFLFITRNDKDGHGPIFHQHMNRINKEAGTNITVFHSFHDEVDHLQKHMWRCNGPCQRVGPYFGIVKRATGRAPGPNDFWWNKHKLQCGGVYEKIMEPPGYKGRKKVILPKASKDISAYVLPPQPSASRSNTNSKTSTPYIFQGKSPIRISNIHTLSDISANMIQKAPPTDLSKPPHSAIRSSNIYTSADDIENMGRTAPGSRIGSVLPLAQPTIKLVPSISNVNTHVRQIWNSKYPLQTDGNKRRANDNISDNLVKKKALKCGNCWDMFDETNFNSHKIMCKSQKCSCPVCEQIIFIDLAEHLSSCLSNSITEDIFCTDETEKKTTIPLSISCPICAVFFVESDINRHIDECLNLKAIKDGSLEV